MYSAVIQCHIIHIATILVSLGLFVLRCYINIVHSTL